jgi:hypothetical protein
LNVLVENTNLKHDLKFLGEFFKKDNLEIIIFLSLSLY